MARMGVSGLGILILVLMTVPSPPTVTMRSAFISESDTPPSRPFNLAYSISGRTLILLELR
jgi:hypothetical protein